MVKVISHLKLTTDLTREEKGNFASANMVLKFQVFPNFKHIKLVHFHILLEWVANLWYIFEIYVFISNRFNTNWENSVTYISKYIRIQNSRRIWANVVVVWWFVRAAYAPGLVATPAAWAVGELCAVTTRQPGSGRDPCVWAAVLPPSNGT